MNLFSPYNENDRTHVGSMAQKRMSANVVLQKTLSKWHLKTFRTLDVSMTSQKIEVREKILNCKIVIVLGTF